jgi:hypothetical protein
MVITHAAGPGRRARRNPSLEPAKNNEGWSERLKAALILNTPGDTDARVAARDRRSGQNETVSAS